MSPIEVAMARANSKNDIIVRAKEGVRVLRLAGHRNAYNWEYKHPVLSNWRFRDRRWVRA